MKHITKWSKKEIQGDLFRAMARYERASPEQQQIIRDEVAFVTALATAESRAKRHLSTGKFVSARDASILLQASLSLKKDDHA